MMSFVLPVSRSAPMGACAMLCERITRSTSAGYAGHRPLVNGFGFLFVRSTFLESSREGGAFRKQPPSRHGCRSEEVRHGHPRGRCTQAGRLQSKRISDRAQDVCFIVRARSEERRVGKECRSWSSSQQLRKKNDRD